MKLFFINKINKFAIKYDGVFHVNGSKYHKMTWDF